MPVYWGVDAPRMHSGYYIRMPYGRPYALDDSGTSESDGMALTWVKEAPRCLCCFWLIEPKAVCVAPDEWVIECECGTRFDLEYGRVELPRAVEVA